MVEEELSGIHYNHLLFHVVLHFKFYQNLLLPELNLGQFESNMNAILLQSFDQGSIDYFIGLCKIRVLFYAHKKDKQTQNKYWDVILTLEKMKERHKASFRTHD